MLETAPHGPQLRRTSSRTSSIATEHGRYIRPTPRRGSRRAPGSASPTRCSTRSPTTCRAAGSASRRDDARRAWSRPRARTSPSVYSELERALAERDFVCGALSIADLALFPHLAAVPLSRRLVRRRRTPATPRVVQAHAPGAGLPRGPRPDEELPRRRRRIRASGAHRLARRPHRVAARAWISCVVRRRDPRRPRRLAAPAPERLRTVDESRATIRSIFSWTFSLPFGYTAAFRSQTTYSPRRARSCAEGRL